MMWRLMHWVFGWQYVHMETHSKVLQMRRRVRKTPAGEIYVKDYVGGGMIFIMRPEVTREWDITPLTWIEPLPQEDKPRMKIVN